MRLFIIAFVIIVMSVLIIAGCGGGGDPVIPVKNCDYFIAATTNNNWLSIYPTDGQKVIDTLRKEGCVSLSCHPGIISNRN